MWVLLLPLGNTHSAGQCDSQTSHRDNSAPYTDVNNAISSSISPNSQVQQHGWFFMHTNTLLCNSKHGDVLSRSKASNISCIWKSHPVKTETAPHLSTSIFKQGVSPIYCKSCCSPGLTITKGLRDTTISGCSPAFCVRNPPARRRRKWINAFTEYAASNIEWAPVPLPPTSFTVCGSFMQWRHLFFILKYLCKILAFHFIVNLFSNKKK